MSFIWDASPDTNVTGYVIYYGTSPGIYHHRIDTGTNIMVSVSGLDDWITYYFVCAAYDSHGQQSAFSNELAFLVPGSLHLDSKAQFPCSTHLSFRVIPGRRFILQTTTNLDDWVSVWRTTITSNTWYQIEDATTPAPARFYRLLMYEPIQD